MLRRRMENPLNMFNHKSDILSSLATGSQPQQHQSSNSLDNNSNTTNISGSNNNVPAWPPLRPAPPPDRSLLLLQL
ncbi:uncharacterized protein Dana_GF11846, isoform C [Drosophila ananassae]|uniref:Uncharacterized protein, isoform C n=1 Tax=Drosophila ananassae TaxID=7217 RepID=A0A0P8XLC9_DROAN|nr:uncharacterized protein Dana_GF11846, isoform C [Drosophila ananassae]